MSERPSPQLFLDDHRGIYIPREFARVINRQRWFGITDEDLATLEDADHDLYWETWDDVLEKAFAYIPHKAGWQYLDEPTLALARAADEAGNTTERDRLLATLPGTRWNVYQDGACWLIPEGMTFTDRGEWIWADDEQDELCAFSEVRP